MTDPGTLDLSGLVCPEVVVRLALHLRGLPPGRRVTVVATDPLSTLDVPVFLHRRSHLLIGQAHEAGRVTFVVETGVADGEE